MQEEWFSLGGALAWNAWMLTGEGWVTKGYSCGCTSRSQTDRVNNNGVPSRRCLMASSN